ncbi:MAG TPA: type VI secretion system tube protein Hcp [Acetobacteraceae bacterium]|nr:type VI secretion system tube protein Hcp [Acetobacteraceae bacterium]
MTANAYMIFRQQDGSYLKSESQTAFQGQAGIPEAANFVKASKPDENGIFEVEGYSFQIEQTLNIGSQSTGAGAGKVTFNPFSITRKIDKASPILFQMASSGTPFQDASLALRKPPNGGIFLVFHFKLVAIKSIAWAGGDESPKELITFEYGGLQVFYGQQKPDGEMMKTVAGGWNRVSNKLDTDMNAPIR